MEEEVIVDNPQVIQLLNDYKNTIPVPVMEIAGKYGLKVYETKSLSDSEAGLIQKEDSGEYSILVNARNSSNRKRFTIAHEIMHFLLHKDYIDSNYITPNKQPVKSSDDNTGLTEEENDREIEANKHASILLMPMDKFREIWKKSNSIEQVAEAFNVSVAAAAIRGDKLLKEIIL